MILYSTAAHAFVRDDNNQLLVVNLHDTRDAPPLCIRRIYAFVVHKSRVYWPIQDILSLVFVCKNQSSLHYPPPICIAHTTAIYHWTTFAQYKNSPRPFLYIPYTIHDW